MMEYKGYIGKITLDDEADLLHGEIINIRDVVTFQGKSVKEIRKAFRESVEDYLAFCRDRGESPEKPFSGKFVIRLSPQQHQKIYIASKMADKSLNAWIVDTLEKATTRNNEAQ